MNRILHAAGWIVSLFLGILILALLTLWIASERELRRVYPLRAESARAATPAAAGEGRRLAKLYGCTSCHGPQLRGHIFNSDAWLVRNIAPNLTLIARHYSDAQFAQAIKQGVRPTDGRALWGMPSQVFWPLTDTELGAVLAFLRAQPAAGEPTTQTSPGLRSRLALVVNALQPSDPKDKAAIRPAPELVALALKHPPLDLGPKLARGRHLTATICSECHGSDLRGDATEGSPDLAVAAAYDLEAFRRLMRTGKSLTGRDLGEMSEAAKSDFRVFTDLEIEAIHAYLVARSERLSRTAN